MDCARLSGDAILIWPRWVSWFHLSGSGSLINGDMAAAGRSERLPVPAGVAFG